MILIKNYINFYGGLILGLLLGIFLTKQINHQLFNAYELKIQMLNTEISILHQVIFDYLEDIK